jgi:hypothetical protein
MIGNLGSQKFPDEVPFYDYQNYLFREYCHQLVVVIFFLPVCPAYFANHSREASAEKYQ